MKHGYPYFLVKGKKDAMSQLMKSEFGKQAILTICKYYMLYNNHGEKPNFDSVTQPSQIRQEDLWSLSENIGSYANVFFEERRITPFQFKSIDHFIFPTPKASASGPNALGISSIKDAIAIYTDQRMFRLFQSMIELVYTDSAVERINKLFFDSIDQSEDIHRVYGKPLARFHILYEGGGKQRIICIPDIWSQIALKPIHDYFMNSVLRRLPCDGTFSHNQLALKMKKMTSKLPFYCTDLSAATDRMPWQLQYEVNSSLLGELTGIWIEFIRDRNIPYEDRYLKYAVGQPMGFLSSWPSMAISNHILVNYSKRDKTPYAVIGDDVGVTSRDGAVRYRHLLNQLGMPINLDKTIDSNGVDNVGEIAKRLFINGKEISPITPDILMNAARDIVSLFEFITMFSQRYHCSNQDNGITEAELSQVLNRLLENSKLIKKKEVQVLLSCPFLGEFDFLPEIPRIECVKDSWVQGVPPKQLGVAFDRFLLEESNRRTNEKMMPFISPSTGEVDVSSRNSHYGASDGSSDSPLYRYTKKVLMDELNIIYKKINTTYVDGEDDSFAGGVLNNLKSIYQKPDPLNMDKIYLSKRKIRQWNTQGLIQIFYDKTRWVQAQKVKP